MLKRKIMKISASSIGMTLPRWFLEIIGINEGDHVCLLNEDKQAHSFTVRKI